MTARQQRGKAGGVSTRATARSTARLAAVQALYQAEVSGKDAGDVILEFETYRLGEDIDGEAIADADADFFRAIVTGVIRRQREIDPMIDEGLAEGWRLGRLDAILRATLRCAACELVEQDDIPARVIIDEYLNIAHAFFSGEEPRAVNGILDGMARRIRPAEFA
ncbi:MAG: transcription antitermination factor NusB [Pseudomonadota bacterium]|nr:transcription antitermination factor NusB [Pseudomonadota bacterium]